MKNNSNREPKADTFRISPKQATALRALARSPWQIDKARHVLQTTLGALYKRGYVAVSGDHFIITPAGGLALHEQSHANIERSHSMFDAGFARVIREFANYRPEKTGSKIVRMPRTRSAA
jgi:hypothetical protein